MSEPKTNQPFDLIMTIVNRGFSDDVMDAARAIGARGGTILHARGSGVHEAEKFFGIAIQPEKEIVMMLVPHDIKNAVMQAVCEKCGLNTQSKGLSFSLPVDDIVGMSGMTEALKEAGKIQD